MNGLAKEKYAMGLKLEEFVVFTGNKNFEKIEKQPPKKALKDMTDEEKLTFKVVGIKGFSLFCDW